MMEPPVPINIVTKHDDAYVDFMQDNKMYKILLEEDGECLIFKVLSDNSREIFKTRLTLEEIKTKNKLMKIHDTINDVIEFLKKRMAINKISINQEESSKLIIQLILMNEYDEKELIEFELLKEDLQRESDEKTQKIINELYEKVKKLEKKLENKDKEIQAINEQLKKVNYKLKNITERLDNKDSKLSEILDINERFKRQKIDEIKDAVKNYVPKNGDYSPVKITKIKPSNEKDNKSKEKASRYSVEKDKDKLYNKMKNYSIILENKNEYNLLKETIRKIFSKEIKDLKLIYNAKDDKGSAELFHKKCDNIQNTLVLIKSEGNKRFGGFTTQTWNGNEIWKDDKCAFLFSLDKNLVYANKNIGKAIYCKKSYGPTFGRGHSIKISDKCLENDDSYTNLCTPKSSYEFNGDKYALSECIDQGGIQLKNYEVYQVIFN